MIILQGAIHIFTEQPNSVAKSIYNGLRRQMTHLLEYETIKTSTIIQYPHAVSYFCELNLLSQTARSVVKQTGCFVGRSRAAVSGGQCVLSPPDCFVA